MRPPGSIHGKWREAAEHGCDMSQIEENLRKSPALRVKAHARALATAVLLRRAKEKKNAGPRTSA